MRLFRFCVAAAVLATVSLPLAVLAQDEKPVIAVALELSQQFYYENDPLSLRIGIHSVADTKISNPLEAPLYQGLHVRRASGEQLGRSDTATVEEPNHPGKLAPRAFYGGVLNLADLFPDLAKAGRYEIYWAADGFLSDMVVVTVLPKFDPTRQYVAEIETDHGSIVMQFFHKEAPTAVKSFIDMANAGLYDGMQFHEVRADAYIAGGDPRFVIPPRRSISFPAEQTGLPLVAGTVVLQPVSAAPPANGSAFVILLKPQPTMTGQVTALAQVVSGLDVVREISQVPSSMQGGKPAFKPLQEVTIRKIAVRKQSDSQSAP